MNLKEKIENFKCENKNTRNFTFKDKSKLVNADLYLWIDTQYSEAIAEYKTKGTQNTSIWLNKLI